MQRYQSLVLAVFVAACLQGCAYIYKDKYNTRYDISVAEMDRSGKTLKVWVPSGTIYTYLDEDAVIFTDSATGERKKISGSYKFLKR